MRLGVMELPFRLLVAALAAAITIPAVTSGLAAFEVQHIAGETVGEIGRIVRVAQQFYVSGGGAERVRVEFPVGFAVRLEYVSIGGDIGSSYETTASYKLVGHAEVVLLTDPAVPLGTGGGPLRLTPARYVIAVAYDGTGSVRLAVVG